MYRLVGLRVGRFADGLAVGLLVVGRPVGDDVLSRNEMCAINSGTSILVPLLAPPVTPHPPFVWIPIALPVWKCRMGPPEFPP